MKIVGGSFDAHVAYSCGVNSVLYGLFFRIPFCILLYNALCVCMMFSFFASPPQVLQHIVLLLFKSRDSSVGIATGYGLDDRGSRFRFPAGAGNFSLHHRVQNGSGAHPASYSVGTRGSFPGVKRPGREADYSHPSSAEAKEWMEPYLHSPIRLNGVVLS
jgi:hypothetical protein